MLPGEHAAAAIIFEGQWTHSQCEGNQLMRQGNKGPVKHVTFIKAFSGMMCDGDTEDRLPRLRKDAIPHYQILARGWPALLSFSLVALRGHLRVPKSQRQCAEQMHFFNWSVLLLRGQTSQGFDRNLQSSQCLYRLFFDHFYELVLHTEEAACSCVLT